MYSFEMIYGFAGTILMLPLLSFIFPTKSLVIFSLLPSFIIFTIAALKSPKVIDLKFFAKILFFALIGGIAGIFLFKNLSSFAFDMSIALVIIVMGFYQTFLAKRFVLHPVALRFLDTFAGLSQALFGISGPIIMTRLLATFDNKTVIRNYALSFFFSLNVVRGISYFINGEFNAEILNMMYWSFLPLALVLYFANKLHFKSSDKNFKKVASWAVLASGFILLVRVLY